MYKLSADQEKIKVTFGAGTYRICNLKSYVSDTTVLEDASLYQSTFTPDRNATKGNQISGSIEMEQDSRIPSVTAEEMRSPSWSPRILGLEIMTG